MRSYFVSRNEQKHVAYFYFDDEIPESIEEAYGVASAFGKRIAAYRPPPVVGPWDRDGLVGHRRHSDIIKDLERATVDWRRDYLMDELAALNLEYTRAGRALPIQTAVAA